MSLDTLPLSLLFLILIALLVLSAFFSLSEMAMMAANRYKLKHLAENGHLGARLALALIARPDRLLGIILLGNNLVNASAAALVGFISLKFFGHSEWALGVATILITFVILVFAEITPKIIGATHADVLSQWLSFILMALSRVFYPAIWFVNLFSGALLRLFGLSLRPAADAPKLTPEELRTLVMESRELIPAKHGALLLNLFELERIVVEDVMTPRGALEFLDISADWEENRKRLIASRHRRLPVCQESMDQLLGVLSVRRALPLLHDEDFTGEDLRALMMQPYYIPAGTPLVAQLGFFQENHQRFGFVVDEYGEILGMVTLEDIVEEIVGEFTTSLPGAPRPLTWGSDGTVIVDGSTTLRDLNRKLGLRFPLDGPKTLNGLIIERLEEIPEARVSLKLGEVTAEVLQAQDRSIKTVRLQKPLPVEPEGRETS
ncbi:MAG: CNNM domain-containing protein [Zoogloeaceae bacterium]|nr:CNNM domain-containing protein [Zoogloeaceae bacterium]